jgi:hypothetical protein
MATDREPATGDGADEPPKPSPQPRSDHGDKPDPDELVSEPGDADEIG